MRLSRISVFHGLAFAGLLLLANVRAQPVSLTGITRTAQSVNFTWTGGAGPFVVQTSPNLVDWGDHGEPALVSSQTLAAGQSSSFYRVRDLGASIPLGPFYGLVQTEQGEFGKLLGRHRLKSRWSLYKPQATPSKVPAVFFRKLIVLYQNLENGRVNTFAGPLEELGAVDTPGNASTMTITWTSGRDVSQRTFTLTLNFPYNLNTARAAEPQPSDPRYELKCVYGSPQPEFDGSTMSKTTTDTINLIQLAPPEPTEWLNRQYTVSHSGMRVNIDFREGNYLREGSPLFILKTYVHHQWTAPTAAAGGILPAFTTDSYFSRTQFPGHHNFWEEVLLEPAVDPGVSEATRAALAAANIRYLYTVKDMADVGVPDAIGFLGFDDTFRLP